MPLFYNMFNGNAPYDPHEPQGTNPRHPRAPVLPRVQQEDGSRVLHPSNAGGELPVIQDLTPSLPPDSNAAQIQPSNQPDSVGGPTGTNGFDNTYPGMQNFGGMPPYPGIPMDASQMPAGDNGAVRPPRDSFRGRRGGRGGSFGGDASSARPQRRGDKTLVVEKIPEDKLTLDQVNTWFKKFGNVTNVAVDNHGAKALVSFSTHEEAHAAWKSEDAVFGNRFVKVFWHRPMEGHGQAGQRALAASASLVANIQSKDSQGAASSSTSAPQIAASTSSSGSKKPSAAASALAAKQEVLQKQIAEQKTLMASLSTATPEQKKDIMARLRKLNEEMNAASASSAPPSTSKSTTDTEEAELKKSDKEGESPANGDAEETTEQLKAKLEKLKAEAASLGISESGAEPPYGGGYRGGYRGRARGRGFYRGGPALRGGPPREGDEGLQAVKGWYEAGGQVESVEALEDGDVLVSFKSRPAAEQGLAKGTNLPTVGKVTITWYTGKPVVPATNPSSSASTASPAQKSGETDEPQEPAQHHHQEEEEMLASGWGDDDADGMGMI
ncbi:hypothetical protein H1R20_g8233, partial [Candolleomyces eurysporus]